MSSKAKKKEKGISLRTIHIWLIIGALVMSVIMFYATFDLLVSYRHLTEVSEMHVELRKDARGLMEASDRLTEQVQRFTVNGDIKFLDDYFSESLYEHHREEAISNLSKKTDNQIAIERLKTAMRYSMNLMNREYYAMKLVIEAKGYTDYPVLLRAVEISKEHKALSSNDKMQLATKMVLDDEYYGQKEQIRENMQACLDELEKAAIKTDESALKSLSEEMIAVRIVIILQTCGVIFLVWLTSRLGIHPILNAVKQIKSNSFIKESGAREFRYLVKAYNRMYENYKKNLTNISFKALHDELTGVYNRAGYQSLLDSMNLEKTCMILFDVDNFKQINDTYGHETGDKVLVKLVDILKNHFRNDDYICRIGGDEFIVFMPNTPNVDRKMISDKINAINEELTKIEDLPTASISVGVAHGKNASDYESLLKKADSAMYGSKKKGKCTVTFYSE